MQSDLKTPCGSTLEPIAPLKDISLDDVDVLDNEVMRRVIEGVVRRHSVPQAHKSHNSHSSTAEGREVPERVEESTADREARTLREEKAK